MSEDEKEYKFTSHIDPDVVSKYRDILAALGYELTPNEVRMALLLLIEHQIRVLERGCE